MLSPSDLKRGLIVEMDGAPCLIVKIDVQTPSARGATMLWKVRGKNLKTKQKVEKVYRGGDTIVEPNFEKRPVQFLYRDGTHLHFMDLESYDQFPLRAEDLKEESQYLVDNMEDIRAFVYEDEVIGIELALAVELKITECDPAVKGNSATNRAKRAVVESGLAVQVPEHLGTGDVIRIDTSTGKFVSRVSKA